MGLSRRSALKALGTTVAALGVPAPTVESSQAGPFSPVEAQVLESIAEVVLPSELGADGRKQVVAGFTAWIRNYVEGADTDHGYGVTRIRTTGPSPAAGYGAQIAALQAGSGGRFVTLPLAERQTLVETAIANARVERLPARPTGSHVASDLMAFYFNSPAAADLCYRAAIGRTDCRGLANSDEPPPPLR